MMHGIGLKRSRTGTVTFAPTLIHHHDIAISNLLLGIFIRVSECLNFNLNKYSISKNNSKFKIMIKINQSIVLDPLYRVYPAYLPTYLWQSAGLQCLVLGNIFMAVKFLHIRLLGAVKTDTSYLCTILWQNEFEKTLDILQFAISLFNLIFSFTIY